MYNGLHAQYPLFLSAFQETWDFLDRFSNTQISSFMKIRPVGAELFHVGGRTVMTKLIVAFHNSANAPSNNQRGNVFFHRIKVIRTTLNKPINIIQPPCNWQCTGKTYCNLLHWYINVITTCSHHQGK
jgi:hypothetical protein